MTELHLEQGEPENLPYNLCQIALLPGDRDNLRQRIARRFNEMLALGLIDEVRQVWAYLDGELDYEEMLERGIIATRQLAKRQLTWLRGWPDLHCIECEQTELVNHALKILRQDYILDRQNQ
jgi:tRNA dimethylallyltransferase